MKNKFTKYFFPKKVEWHDYEIGTYHISAIGCSHFDLKPKEHYGPCLRRTFFDYKEGKSMDEEGEGAVTMGKIIHREIQKAYLKGHPASVIEFPIIKKYGDITIKGSVDIIQFLPKLKIIDIKTASDYTFPSSGYVLNPTYLDQIAIYLFCLKQIFQEFNLNKVVVVFVRKRNLETIELKSDVSNLELSDKYIDFTRRVNYLHECLIKNEMPYAETMKWCRYCPYLKDVCLARGDVIEVKKGRKTRYLKNDIS